MAGVSMNPRDVEALLHRILLTTLAATAGACTVIDTGGYDLPSCAAGDWRVDYLAGLMPAEAFDYVDLRRRDGFDAAPFEVVQSIGTPCLGANDPDSCLAQLAAVAPDAGFRIGQCVQICDEHAFVLTRGDAVEVVSSVEEALALLGPIDTPTEAVLRAGLAEYAVSCDDPERGGVREAGDGYEVLATRLTADCDPIETTLYRLGVGQDANVTELESEVVESESGACVGRRPSCLERNRARGRSALGAYFASVAHLEHAAAFAFGELARELVHHGAPRSLVARAERSRRDELHHTALMRRLARRLGGAPPRARAHSRPPRPLEEIALHNASEGCVRESFGALIGLWQARRAADSRVRQVMSRVARDELRHAAFSWELDRFARVRLGERVARRLDEARREALTHLAAEVERPVDPTLVRAAGLPARDAHRALFEGFARALG
jgi:hypothetical protein